MMANRPPHTSAQAQVPAAYAPMRPAPQAPINASDPFRSGRAARPSPSEDLDLVPKRSSKTLIIAVVGLVAVAGLGFALKLALSDDEPKAAAEPMVTGPAVTTAEIPPPPPKTEPVVTANPPTPTSTANATAAPRPVDPPSTPVTALPTPVAQAPQQQQANFAPRNHPQPPPPPAPPTPAPPSPKTAPKSPNGGIVRDNPF
jgi:hypothetical protein